MLEWYKDEEIAIYFSREPQIRVRYPHPNSDSGDVCAKPFLSENELEVVLMDFIEMESFSFVIPKGYCWDGATIPRFFWRFVGSKTDNRFLIPSLVHDFCCENHEIVNHDRYFADKVFERLLFVSGVNPFLRWLMFHSVDNFQKFCGWGR